MTPGRRSPLKAASIVQPPPPLLALHQLPVPLPDFTGREAELAELRAALEQGGVGKTALAHVIRAYHPEAKLPESETELLSAIGSPQSL